MLLKLQFPPGIPTNVPLLVAYSGGADSSLLLALAKAYGELHQVPVFAAHLHHGIRGAEADRDLNFCRQTARGLGIPLFEKRVDIPALAHVSGKSLETEAREQRYAFFHEIMEAKKIPLLLTAHHADDQLETLLFRFLRGCGTKGVGGIPKVRPLAYGTADEVDAYCKRTLEICMPHKGYHFAPSHAIQDNSPEENVIAMYQAAHDFGRYE